MLLEHTMTRVDTTALLWFMLWCIMASSVTLPWCRVHKYQVGFQSPFMLQTRAESFDKYFLPLVLFLAPRRPHLHGIHEKGQTWIYTSWNLNTPPDNVSHYEVRHSYVGECSEISREEVLKMLDGANSTHNITGLEPYLNYSITLIAINGTGQSPPNTVFVVTRSTGTYCMHTCSLASHTPHYCMHTFRGLVVGLSRCGSTILTLFYVII